MLSPIPNWNAQGVLPPVDAQDPTSHNRSPYFVSLVDFVAKFAISPERIAIMQGFLRYRAALHAIGLRDGFQWLDGSFLENKEQLLAQSPADVDVVTFFRLPAQTSEADLIKRNSGLFDPGQHQANKKHFQVDAFFLPLYTPAERLIKGSNYWYGMWSHQRQTLRWKGFLQLDLAPVQDAEAAQLLLSTAGGATA